MIYRDLLTWGAGRFGQLGNSERADKAKVQEISKFVPPKAGRVVQVNYTHSYVLNVPVQLIMYGHYRFQLGVDTRAL